MEVFKYRFKGYPVITSETFRIARYIDGDMIEVTLDLGLSKSLLEVTNDRVLIDGFEYSLSDLSNLKDGYVYVLINGNIYRLAYYKDKYFYRLLPISPTDAPTLEISGIRMHRTQDTTPWLDSLEKVSLLNIRRGTRVLDICTGLGYIAIHAFKMGGVV